MILFEFNPAIRLALLLMPTDWIYMPRAVFFKRMATIRIQIAAMITGVGMIPQKPPKNPKLPFLT